MDIDWILWLAAAICMGIAAIGVNTGKLRMLELSLFFVILTMLV